jgi:hypothetical protein
MSEPHEQDEAAETAADEPGPSDDETSEDEAAEAEEAAHEPVGGDTDGGEEAGTGEAQPGTQAHAKAARDEQRAIDKMFKSFEGEAKRHDDRVEVIAGDSADDLLQCPMCAPDEGQPPIPGWLLPVKPSEEKIANVRLAIGLAPKIDYREDPHSQVCPTCGGLKSVLPTGGDSTAPLLGCADCKSQGWIATDEVRGGAVTNGVNEQNVELRLADAPKLEPDSPEVAALKQQGYTVIAPHNATG